MNLRLFKITISSYDSVKNDIEITIKTTNNKDYHDIQQTIREALYAKGLLTGGSSSATDWKDIDLANLSLLRGEE